MFGDDPSSFAIAPWDKDTFTANPVGNTFLESIEAFGDIAHVAEYTIAGIRVREWALHADASFPKLAGNYDFLHGIALLPFWCMLTNNEDREFALSDDHILVHTPDGLLFEFSEDMLRHYRYRALSLGGLDALNLYWEYARRDLADWIAEPLHLGISPAHDALYKAVSDPLYEARVESLPAERLVELAACPLSQVRESIALRPDCSAELIDTLASDMDAGVRGVIASRSDVPEELLDQLALDGQAGVRHAVAQNSHTSDPTLNCLSADEDTYVATAAQTSLRSREEEPTVEWKMGGSL
ncbi:MAG: hypothetical protein ACYCTG_06665 [Ferrimicrobium sp.]